MLDSSEFYQQVCDKAGKHGVMVETVGLNLQAMMMRKDEVVQRLTDGISFLFKKQKVSSVCGTVTGVLKAPHGFDVLISGSSFSTISASKVLLATGSQPIELPMAPFDGSLVISSTEALALKEVPKHLVVVGGGYIGLELGSVWRRLGAACLLDDLDRLEDSIPQVDGAIRFAVWSVIRGVIGHDEPYDLIVYAFGEAAAFAPAGRPSLNDGGIARPHMRISAVREYREAAAGEARDAAIRIQSGETDTDAVLDAAGDVFDLQAVIGPLS